MIRRQALEQEVKSWFQRKTADGLGRSINQLVLCFPIYNIGIIKVPPHTAEQELNELLEVMHLEAHIKGLITITE